MKLTALQAGDWLDPESGSWAEVTEERMALTPTPVSMSPAPYIQHAYTQPREPSIPWCELRAGVSAERVHLLLSWPDATRDDTISDATTFSDAAALVFAPDAETPLATMGDDAHPVIAVYWRAVDEAPLLVCARGIGTSAREQTAGCQQRAIHDGASWRIALSLPRDLRCSEGALPFDAGASAVFAAAVWDGARAERAGLKSFSAAWRAWNVDA